MTITGSVTILMFALAPYIWFIVTGVVMVVGLHLLAYLRGYQIAHHRSLFAILLAALVGLTAFVWVPWLTHSTLGYVATVFDWVALTGAAIATFVVALIVLHPLSYLISDRHTD
ncbi:hypothetical protein [Vreelandella boliviensis]|uniref:G-protein coupled receptors family 1 profile domain-containing protein n=1 Tax=Vreelandella boliviensis LC1 TaxID=1072583 RepID=A0A265E1V3_9GAMM|nr:hypothetical protein [Halomonas boliviensis]EHJ94590.1 hypothetical protein KUC_1549 [Halomonas boliviensis LC1]OZT75564.1 hypothetical protein CE457_04005 [Halomonas boliviensis LC1]